MARIRPARDADAEAVIALITRVYAEYPGCILDVDREEPALRAPASSFDRFWVVEDASRVVGCVGCALGAGLAELKKLYLDAGLRGQGLGRDLIALVEETARAAGARQIELWSDTRFKTAHAVYERCGYRRTGRTRDLHDLSNTTEFHFEKEL
ncbi:MAG: GNAT family N-acetyltransferase [Planctomycetota bacterium]